MYKLVISDDEGKTTTVPLVRDEITIGRKEGNTIRLTERNVSRRHARLQKQNGHYLLQDLGSYNGIVINGMRLGETRPLRAGDQIQIGDYKLAILEEGAAQSAGPPMPGSDVYDPGPAAMAPGLAPHSTAPAIPSAMGGGMHGLNSPGFPDLAAPNDAAFRSAPPISAEELPRGLHDLRLVFLAPAGAPPPYNIDSLPIILGRSELAQVNLPFSSISREHARLSLVNGELIIEDLGSSNGININGAKVPSGPVRVGDQVTMGVVEMRIARRGEDTVLFRPELGGAATKKRSTAPIMVGVLGGGAVLGLVAFFLLRSPTRPAATTASNQPAASAQPTAAPPSTSLPPSTTELAAAAPPAPPSTVPEATPAPTSAPSAGSSAATPAPASAPLVAAVSPMAPAAPAAPIAPPVPVPPARVEPAVAPPPPPERNPSTVVATNTTRVEPTPASAPATNPTHTERHHPPTTPTTNEHPASGGTTPPGPGTQTATRPGLTPAGGGANSPLQQALACHTEPNCVIGALGSGRARGMQELEMLVAAYRSSGRRADAVSTMRTYLARYPNGPRAPAYQNIIEDN